MLSRTSSTVIAFVCASCIVVAGVAQPQNIPPVEVAPPGDTGRRITDDGLLANYFPAREQSAALLLLGGSVGGLSTPTNDVAKALQAEGFSVLHLSYFRAPGQNPRLELFPLEYFDTALAWLRRQPEVDSARMGIVGVSKGAEAGLLIAVRHPELRAVIAALPSSVVWPGIVWEGTNETINSSWSEGGKPLPHMTHVPYDARRGGTMADNYAKSLLGYAQHPDAIIPVEKINGRLLLVCGGLDDVSPSCPMLRQIEERLRQHGRPAPISIVHEQAGHRAFGLAVPVDSPRFKNATAAMRRLNAQLDEGWKKSVEFLKSTLAKP